MPKLCGDYKYKFMTVKVEDKNAKNILLNMITEHIEKLTEEIEQQSKSEYGAQQVIDKAKEIAQCMEWRKNIEFLGTDTCLRDLEFYKNGVERFY